MISDTYILLEQLGHRLDRESERRFNEALAEGLSDTDITEYIERNIDVAAPLRESAPVWDGGYVLCGVTGSGEAFAMRDPWGIRPAFWYADDEVWALASERPVLQTTFNVEASEIRELMPGQAVVISRSGKMRLERINGAEEGASMLIREGIFQPQFRCRHLSGAQAARPESCRTYP